MQLQPLSDWVVLQEIASEEAVTKTGIILSNDGLVQVGRAKIMFISKKLQKEFKENDDVDLKQGDQVIFSKFQAEEVRIKDDEGKWMERVKVAYKFAIQCKITDDANV
jgi:co-chaperonin GroES (HSP10)